MSSLDELRNALNAVDSELMQLIHKRQQIALEIGRVKRAIGRPTRDWQREREVLERVEQLAAEIGLPDGLAQRILQQIIQASLQVQSMTGSGHKLPVMATPVLSLEGRAKWDVGLRVF